MGPESKKRRKRIRRAFAAAAWIGLVVLSVVPGHAAGLPGYSGSQSCVACHRSEAEAWAGSHHSWALKRPSADSVLGDFDEAEFRHGGRTTRFFRKGDRYYVTTEGADAEQSTFEIAYVVGVAPLQQYLVALDRGRLQALDIAWDTEKRRWFHLYPDDDVGPGNGLHWTGPYKNWQARCAVCHQTGFAKNYDPETRTYRSTWSELTIGCEACHGPGAAHVAWAQRRADFDAAAYDGIDGRGLVRLGTSDRQAIEQNMCGPCHARREALSADSTPPGAPFADHHRLSLLRDGLYFADGQQNDEVYILGSFLQSKMHRAGVTCGNCHDPHSARLVADGNAVCTQCHNEAGRPDFPTLKAGLFDTPAHHHHAEGSAGAACVSCHMPERDYMIVDGRRDHYFRVPDPLVSQRTGSPDACLSCHEEQTHRWAAAAIESWAPQHGARSASYAEAFTEARTGPATAESITELAAIAQDASQPAIVRATALDELAAHSDETAIRALSDLLADASDLVRLAAVRLWRAAPASERVRRLPPLLDDSVRSVRIAAALELANIPLGDVPDEARADLRKALDELRASLNATADFPETQMAIGGLAMSTRDWDAARAAFATATLMDPQLVRAWQVRARIVAALGDPGGAAAILERAIVANPENADIAGERGKLLYGQGRLAEAIPMLRKVLDVRPADQETRLALAAALLRTGDLAAAQAEIEVLRRDAPARPEGFVLRALRQLMSGDATGARTTVGEIKDRFPGLRLPPALEALSTSP